MSFIKYSLLEDSIGDIKRVDDIFLFNLYYYYLKGGYYNLIFSEIVHLGISSFLLFFINIIITCVDFHLLMDLEQKDHISHYIHMEQFFKMEPFIAICFFSYVIYAICKIISLYYDCKRYKKIKEIYNNKLLIQDEELATKGWDKIVNRILEKYNDPNLNVYTVSNRILKKKNIIISLFDGNILELDYLTKLLEWNIIFCFVNSLFNNKNNINKHLITNRHIHKESVKRRLVVILICNLIFMPFILFFMCFYTLLKYGEKFYNNPKLLNYRKWTLQTRWKMRYYNELPHIFYARLSKTNKYAKEYYRQFENKLLITLFRLINFMIGSVFFTLLILTFLNENLLINLYISHDKPVLWYLGLFGTILAINKSLTIGKYDFYPAQKMKKLRKYVPELPKEWESPNSKHKENFKHFLKLYQNKLIILLKECIYTIITPIIIFQLRNKSDKIIDYMIDNINNHYVLEYVCKKSIFTDIEILKNNKKTQFSFAAFHKNHPNWCTDNIMLFNLQETVNSLLLENINTLLYHNSIESSPKKSFMFNLSASTVIESSNNMVSTIQENRDDSNNGDSDSNNGDSDSNNGNSDSNNSDNNSDS